MNPNISASNTRQALARKRLVLLALGMICLLFFGLVYGYSMFVKSMTTDFGLPSVGPIFYVMMICFCFGTLISSALLKRIEPRTLLIGAGVLYAIDFCATGLLCGQYGLVILYGCYAIIGGLAAGAGYSAVVGTVTLWFPDKTGIASGVLLLGFGISSLLLGNAVLALRSVVGSIGPVFIGVGVAGALLALMLGILITRPPQNIAQIMASNDALKEAELRARADTSEQTGTAQAQNQATESVDAYDPSARFEDSNMLKSPTFYAFFITMLLVSIMGLSVIGSVAGDGMSLGLDEGFASLLVGLAACCNGLSRIVLGALMDRKGVPFSLIICEAVGFAGMACIFVAFVGKLPFLYVAGVFLSSFAYGGNPVMGSTFTRVRFGAKQYPFNLAVVNSSLFFGAMVNILVSAIAGTENRFAFVAVCICAMGIALALTFIVRKMWNKDFAKAEQA